MSKEKIKLNSEKIEKRESRIKVLKLGLLISTVFLIILFFLLKIVYGQGPFTISLDQNFAKKSGIVIYENPAVKEFRRILEAGKLEFMDNISIRWIPENIDTEADGAHNGNNYIAYTFYVENRSDNTMDYWYEVVLDDVIKNVDEALRVMVILNGEKTVYAKLNSTTNEPEKNTKAFYSKDKVASECRKDFKSGEIDRCTVVIWIEGNDPECLDDLIGGEIKMHMSIIEDHIPQQNNIEKKENEGNE